MPDPHVKGHTFDDLSWCTRCWRARMDLVDNQVMTCVPTNVVPLAHAAGRREVDRLIDNVLRLMGEAGWGAFRWPPNP